MDVEPKVNMTVYAPEPVRRRIKSVAALRHQSLSEFVVETMTQEMNRIQGTETVKQFCCSCGHDVYVRVNGAGNPQWATHQHDLTAAQA